MGRVCQQVLPQEASDHLCQQCGVIERQRQLHLGRLVRAIVVSAGTPGGAYQLDILRSSLECEVPRVMCAAYFRWFDAPPEQGMAAPAERALTYMRAPPVNRPGLLSGVPDWYVVDSATVMVRDVLIDALHRTGDDAGS